MVGDRISALPDEVLLHVLSFLSTKQAVATSVLSKKWRFLWHSVSTFDFNSDGFNHSKEAYLRFVQSVYNVLNSGDVHRIIRRFRLRCSSRFSDANDFNTWINVAVQRRIEHLDFSLFSTSIYYAITMALPSSRTLVHLNLKLLRLKVPSSVDFPSLKILHLNRVDFSERAHLAELLSGSPDIEDLNVAYSYFCDVSNEKSYKSLTKLVKARISNFDINFEAVKYSQFLQIDWIDDNHDQEPANPYIKELIPIFPNLTHLEFTEISMTHYWPELVIEILKRSPKLQFLSIDKDEYDTDEDETKWTYPQSVPECISSHLRTCCFNRYTGTCATGEFELASYIMENATCLQSMTIRTDEILVDESEKLELREKLSMCARQSSNCELHAIF